MFMNTNFFLNRVVLIIAISLSSSFSGGLNMGITPMTTEYAPHEVLIQYSDRSHITGMKMLKTLLGDSFTSKVFNHFPVLAIKSNQYSVEELRNIFLKVPGVESVAPNYIRHIHGSTNDTHYNDLWAIENRGQDGGTVDADIDAKEAWEIQTGSRDVVVAVVDTGVDYNHPDLAENMWDGSAYNAPHHGWDFAGDSNGNNDNDPNPGSDDDLKHGTHVAGTIGAVSNNSRGIVGIAQHVSLMAVKVFRPNGYGYDSDILEGMEFISDMVDQGVNIVAINASYGGGGRSDVMYDAIEELGSKGVVFCASSGNEDNNNDSSPSYPASYDLDNIISVAATDRDDQLASFSNYGANSVDIAAPGVAILSTTPGNNYESWNGTSMAAPHVAGAIALLAANHTQTSVSDRIELLLSSVDTLDSLSGKVATGGRLNIQSALIADGGSTGENHAPIANAGENQTLEVGNNVVLDGSHSTDTDGDTLQYQWQFNSKPSGSSATLIDANTVHPYFTADVAGTYTLQLIVNDGQVDSGASAVTITITDDGGNSDVTSWTTGAYDNNEDRRETLHIAGATSLTVHITGETEARYDYIYIYDASGNQVAKLDGKLDKTITVSGSEITARLKTDGSVTKSGVTVSISSQ